MESMLGQPAAMITPMFQMFCFGLWSCSFPQSLCQPPWSSSRPAAIFPPRYLDYSFLNQYVNLHKACYECIPVSGQKKVIAVIKGATNRLSWEWATRLGVELFDGGRWRESIFDTGARIPLPRRLFYLTSNPKDKLPLMILEIESTHCITDCHFLAQWTVGTIPAWQIPLWSHCYIL